MIDFETGSPGTEKYMEMVLWCYENYGDQSSPIHDRKGTWRFGHATVHGWTWVGFKSKEMMEQFLQVWGSSRGFVDIRGADTIII